MKTFLALVVFLVAQLLACAIVLVAQPTSTGTLKACVVDTAGGPIVGAVLRLEGTRQGGMSKAPTGSVAVAGIRPGDYIVLVTGPGFSRELRSVRIVACETTSLGDIVLTPVPFEPYCVLPCRGPMIDRYRVTTVRRIQGHQFDVPRADAFFP